jgi:hypothetical protein
MFVKQVNEITPLGTSCWLVVGLRLTPSMCVTRGLIGEGRPLVTGPQKVTSGYYLNSCRYFIGMDTLTLRFQKFDREGYTKPLPCQKIP